jgi:hypothetical protein
MPYEDPIEAALRALTDVPWQKRKHGFEARMNHTHLLGVQEALGAHGIAVQGEVSAARSGRYIATVGIAATPAILKAVKITAAAVKPHRRKWHS